jgi:hypothetical protein
MNNEMEDGMEILGTKRLDHLGLVMGTLRELGVIELINQKIRFCEGNLKR